jgi:hypothetical protein
VAAAPVPHLFANDPDEVQKARAQDTGKVYQRIMRLNKLLLMPDAVNLKEAAADIKKPWNI